MLKLGNSIRLSDSDVKRIGDLTGEIPKNITTAHGLNNFINFHLTQYSNNTPEEKLLALLLEDEKIAG